MSEKFYTVFEIHRMNGETFPYWLQPWEVFHSILLVKGWVFSSYFKPGDEKVIHSVVQGRGHFICDRYTPDKKTKLGGEVTIGFPELASWLPA